VNALNCFAVRRQRVPGLGAHFEAAIVNTPTSVDGLSSHYLAALAGGLAYQGVAGGGGGGVYDVIARRAAALAPLPAVDYDNLAGALAAAGAPALPAGVTRGAPEA